MLSQRGEGTSNIGTISRMTDSHRADNGQRWDGRARRLELPIFDGTDLDGWVFRAERFFDLNVMLENVKLEATILSMEGEAIAWF